MKSDPHNTAKWFVEVSGQVYGPYSLTYMKGFIIEGRVTPASMVSVNPAHGFRTAQQTELFQTTAPTPLNSTSVNSPSPTITPAPQITPNQKNKTNPAQEPEPRSIVYLIMAEFGSENIMKFLHLLQKLGIAQRIGDSVWLLRTQLSMETVKLQLSAVIARQDRLFILDSFNNQTSWHNIGADMDERIQKLWSGEKL